MDKTPGTLALPPTVSGLTRRGFHAGLLGSALAALALPRAAVAAVDPGPDLWLNRLSHGATPASRQEFAGMGWSMPL